MFVNGVEIITFKAKGPDINAIPLFIEKKKKKFSVGNLKKTGLNGYFSGFSLDYDSIAVDEMI